MTCYKDIVTTEIISGLFLFFKTTVLQQVCIYLILLLSDIFFMCMQKETIYVVVHLVYRTSVKQLADLLRQFLMALVQE